MNSEIVIVINPSSGVTSLTVIADSAAERDEALAALTTILPFVELVEAAAKKLSDAKVA
jgi:hypothetical protein